MADRPGVMLYLDLRPAISYLSDADKGRLLDAILAYAADGTPLDDADGTLAAIWALLQPRIDRDAVAYKQPMPPMRVAVVRLAASPSHMTCGI